MAVNISDNNLQEFNNAISNIQNTLGKWDAPCNQIKQFLTGDVGSVFSENFGTGRKAQQAISSLVDILQEMEGSISTLCKDTIDYIYSVKAAQDEAFN